jgi:hypothetical protein
MGLWTVSEVGSSETWNLCIMQVSEADIRVIGYAFKTSELGMANPPSYVTYTYNAVMGAKCQILAPDTVSSDAPTVQGNGVTGNNVSGFYITDGVTTATWSWGQKTDCPFPIPGT